MRRAAVLAFVIGAAVASAASAYAAGPGGWEHLGDGGTPGTPSLNGTVSVLNSDAPGQLLAGGNFTDAGGDPNADRIAVWNGSAWSAVSSPSSQISNGLVDAIAFANGKVFAGGTFQNAGGNADADFLAVWDGASWQPFCNAVGPAFGGNVSALQVIGSTLYVGGAFQNGAGIPAADYLLACDLTTGAAASTVSTDGDFPGAVYGLTADSAGTLYAGGQFINLDGILAADHVAAYDGTWHALGGGPGPGFGAVDDFVRSIDAAGTDVYIGTDSVNVGGIPQADHVARWDGSAWSAVGADTAGANGWFPASTFINSIVASPSSVAVTGSFQDANGDPTADNIASFDAGSWHAVGSSGAGNGPWIGNGLALASFGGLLNAGGSFTSAGGDTQARFVARYAGAAPPDTTAPVTKLNGKAKVNQRARKVTLRFSSDDPGATFGCRLDKKLFKACDSPQTYKHVKPGKHKFQVEATDAAGNVDPTPATTKFKIKRKN